MQMMADRCKLTPTILRRLLERSNLDADALICEDQSSGELLVNTMAVSDPDLECLYDILYAEAEVGVCHWVQCDLCNKWRRYYRRCCLHRCWGRGLPLLRSLQRF